jgi:AcrR family transcriptional regulator
MNDPGSEARADAPAGRTRTRARIVEVAAGLLAAGGTDAVSTRAVALAAGTQAPAIYRLFGDKDGLLDAVAEYGFASYLARKPSLAPSADPVADLRAGWDLHISFGLENPALFSLMHSDAGSRGRVSPAAAAAFTMLRQRIRTIAAAGRLRVSERLAADMLHAAGCGTVLTLLSMPAQASPAPVSEAMFDAVIAAIATPAPAPGAALASAPGGPAATVDAADATAGVVPAANALRAALPGLGPLSPGERHVLGEWLDRVIAGSPASR